MTDGEKELLNTFETKLRHLIYLYEESERKNGELRQLLADGQAQYKKLEEAYGTLRQDYTNLKTAATISLNGSDVKETKLRLSKLVREVDKCIALMDD
ncbi:MAG: hypothetical protein LUB83_03815 [Prevotellaceae bacterium]|nr:hypothetical protein [Prevotellaceae bacterium]